MRSSKMTIESMHKMTGHVVVIKDGDETIYYERRSADDWRFQIGDSVEACYDCAEIEDLYQARLSELDKHFYDAHQKYKTDW